MWDEFQTRSDAQALVHNVRAVAPSASSHKEYSPLNSILGGTIHLLASHCKGKQQKERTSCYTQLLQY
jgi:hypothetical protein